jgi:uncharacterized protein
VRGSVRSAGFEPASVSPSQNVWANAHREPFAISALLIVTNDHLMARRFRDAQLKQCERDLQTMKDLLETIAKALVANPHQVQIRAVENGQIIVFELRVHPSDIRKVIGHKGDMPESIKTIFDAASVKVGSRIMMKILK